MNPPPARCKTCGAQIFWALAHTGSAMPIDSQPSDDGNLVLSFSRTSGQLKCEPYSPGSHFGRRRFKSHFATCAQASQHRRK